MMKVIGVLLFFFPWFIRRRFYSVFFKYKIHPSAYIGFAWVYPKHLTMDCGSRIGHFTVVINVEKVFLGRDSIIDRSNWITGCPLKQSVSHFKHKKNRMPQLVMRDNSSITKSHHIDCTDSVYIGAFTTIAGYRSQFLTHSIDTKRNRQDCSPIRVGDYCFVGTDVIVLGGACLPSFSVLAAKSLLNKDFKSEWRLYGGVPALEIKSISKDDKYFSRKQGFVY